MLTSVALGFLAGAVGFAPLLFVWRVVLIGSAPYRSNATAIGLLGVGFSFLILLAALYICFHFVPDAFPVFAGALVVTFLAACLGIAIMEMRR